MIWMKISRNADEQKNIWLNVDDTTDSEGDFDIWYSKPLYFDHKATYYVM